MVNLIAVCNAHKHVKMAGSRNKTSWALVGDGADLRIVEVRNGQVENVIGDYAEAKRKALSQLREHIAPYLSRIAEIESDHFKVTGALPAFKAWVKDSSCGRAKVVLIASTKKRAIEMACDSQYGFGQDYTLADGDWWYHLARGVESVWVEEQDDNHRGTGVFYRPVERTEADVILDRHLSHYREMPIGILRESIGQTITTTGESSAGTPFRLVTTFRVGDQQHDQISVQAEFDDCLNWWYGRAWLGMTRDLPKIVCNWQKDGF